MNHFKAAASKAPIRIIAGVAISLLLLLLGALITAILTPKAFGDVNNAEQTNAQVFQTFNFLAATTTNATSTNLTGGGGWFKIAGANDVLFYFTRGDANSVGNAGSSVFRVQVTPDGTTWYDYNELAQVTITSDANSYFTRTGTSTALTGTTTQMYIMDDLEYLGVRCIATRVTDGENTCKASADW